MAATSSASQHDITSRLESTIQLESAAQLEAQGFWHWAGNVLAGEALVDGIQIAAEVIPFLLLIAEDNPAVVLPGIAVGVNSGDVDLDDYDLPEEAKESIQTLSSNLINSI